MAEQFKLGVDVSTWNRVDWKALRAAGCTFVIVRFAYGTKPDKRAREHVRQARLEAFQVGPYQFFRECEDPGEQFGVFLEVDELVGYEPADIIPSLDVEDDPGAPAGRQRVTPAWSAPAKLLSDLLAEQYGQSQTYLSRYTWLQLGRPKWVLERPLWIAKWSEDEPGELGGEDWEVWQRHVGPMPGSLGRDLDQDVARQLVLVPHPGPLGMTRGEVDRIKGVRGMALQQTYESTRRNR